MLVGWCPVHVHTAAKARLGSTSCLLKGRGQPSPQPQTKSRQDRAGAKVLPRHDFYCAMTTNYSRGGLSDFFDNVALKLHSPRVRVHFLESDVWPHRSLCFAPEGWGVGTHTPATVPVFASVEPVGLLSGHLTAMSKPVLLVIKLIFSSLDSCV